MELPYYKQEACHTCGAAVARMIINGLLGIDEPESFYIRLLKTNDQIGTKREAFEALGALDPARLRYKTGTDANIEKLIQLLDAHYAVGLLYMLHQPGETPIGHWALLKRIDGQHLTLQDPWMGADYTLTLTEFLPHWHSDPNLCGGVKDPAPWIAVRKI